MSHKKPSDTLWEISKTLQRLAPSLPVHQTFFEKTPTYIWQNYDGAFLHPVFNIPYQELEDLRGLELQKKLLWENSYAFAKGMRANNALLWGARGMGKSSLVKSIVMRINQEYASHVSRQFPLILIELPTEELNHLGMLIEYLRSISQRAIIFCDDLSFNDDDERYRSLKSSLDGGLRGWPENVLIYATSNRRHLITRSIKENETDEEIHPSETVEEKVSLSDRFGLWLGFYACHQELFDDIVLTLAKRENITLAKDKILQQAHTFSRTRGGLSGRVAQQFLTALKIRQQNL